jgi:hypothetical protein
VFVAGENDVKPESPRLEKAGAVRISVGCGFSVVECNA